MENPTNPSVLKKITLCGSIAFYPEMLKAKEELEARGFEVKLPPNEIMDNTGNFISVTKYYELRKASTDDASWIWDTKAIAMRNHFEKIEWSDAILVLNYPKNNIEGYVGANTLIEMGLAFHLKKPIYLLNQIPEISYKEEILGMKPVVINQDLSKLA